MLRVLGRKTSGNVQKVIWLLEEMGEPYKREDYGRQFNNTQDAAYLALNPNGKVPTIVDGDTVVWESNTILRYLANKRGSPLYPGDPAGRSQVERWMDWQLASLNGPYLAIFRDAKKPEAERGPSWAKDAEELGQQIADSRWRADGRRLDRRRRHEPGGYLPRADRASLPRLPGPRCRRSSG